jgi:hypothetical protein
MRTKQLKKSLAPVNLDPCQSPLYCPSLGTETHPDHPLDYGLVGLPKIDCPDPHRPSPSSTFPPLANIAHLALASFTDHITTRIYLTNPLPSEVTPERTSLLA